MVSRDESVLCMVLCMCEVSKNTGFSEERRSRGKQTKILKRWHKAEKERHGKKLCQK